MPVLLTESTSAKTCLVILRAFFAFSRWVSTQQRSGPDNFLNPSMADCAPSPEDCRNKTRESTMYRKAIIA
jgi:hypothetical protein